MSVVGVIGSSDAGERRPAARFQRHAPRLGRRDRGARPRTLPPAGSRPARARRGGRRASARSRSPAASPTCSRAAPSASRCAATRWADVSRCTWRWPRPSGWRGWCSSPAAPGSQDEAERAARRARRPRARRGAGTRAVRGVHRALAHAAAVRAEPPRVRELASRRPAPQPPRRARGGAARHRHGRDAAAVGRLGELAMPVTVLAGERDQKFRALGQRMVELLPDAALVVLAGGHGLPLENPRGLGAALATAPASSRSPTAP